MTSLRNILLLCVAVSTTSCICLSFIPANVCAATHYADKAYEYTTYTKYIVQPKQTTPRGVKVDNSGITVDLNYIDEQTAILENCLGIKITGCAVTVKIAPDFIQEPTGQWFPCAIPGGECAGVNQYPNVLVLPPSLRAYRHELIHLMTHKQHGDLVFTKCDGQ